MNFLTEDVTFAQSGGKHLTEKLLFVCFLPVNGQVKATLKESLVPKYFSYSSFLPMPDVLETVKGGEMKLTRKK